MLHPYCFYYMLHPYCFSLKSSTDVTCTLLSQLPLFVCFCCTAITTSPSILLNCFLCFYVWFIHLDLCLVAHCSAICQVFFQCNTTDMDFSRDEHDWYGKISSVLLCAHANMFVLEFKVKYTIICTYYLNRTMIPGNIMSSLPCIVTSAKHE